MMMDGVYFMNLQRELMEEEIRQKLYRERKQFALMRFTYLLERQALLCQSLIQTGEMLPALERTEERAREMLNQEITEYRKRHRSLTGNPLEEAKLIERAREISLERVIKETVEVLM